MDISQCSFVKFSGAYLEGAEPAPSRHMVTYVWNILTRGILRRLKSSEIRFRPGLYSGATGWDHDAPSNSLVGWEGADPFLFHPHSSPIDVTFLMSKFKKKILDRKSHGPLTRRLPQWGDDTPSHAPWFMPPKLKSWIHPWFCWSRFPPKLLTALITHQSVATVVMMNWEPFVSAPLLVIDSIPTRQQSTTLLRRLMLFGAHNILSCLQMHYFDFQNARSYFSVHQISQMNTRSSNPRWNQTRGKMTTNEQQWRTSFSASFTNPIMYQPSQSTHPHLLGIQRARCSLRYTYFGNWWAFNMRPWQVHLKHVVYGMWHDQTVPNFSEIGQYAAEL